MVYKFLILSDEVDHFAREIEIDSEATFLELNDAILESVGYTKDQLTSFFICENNWEKKTEVTLMDMETGYDEDSWVMGETRLSELLEEEKQRMLFVFDNMTERASSWSCAKSSPAKIWKKPYVPNRWEHLRHRP